MFKKLVHILNMSAASAPQGQLQSSILRRIRAKGTGWAFTPSDFADFGAASSIGTTLSRLAAKGLIRRVQRGIYEVPHSHPIVGTVGATTDAVIAAIARRDGLNISPSGAYAANALGLSDQVPARVFILTDGASRKVMLGNLVIRFCHTCPRNLLGAGTPVGIIFQAIRYLRRDGVTAQMIAQLNQRIDASAKRSIRKLTPQAAVWMRPILRQIAE